MRKPRDNYFHFIEKYNAKKSDYQTNAIKEPQEKLIS